jgi:sugar O-acyltransferase (sialic acid O-acetyltransferase NeuD family)
MEINNSLLLIGGGGHCKSVLDTISSGSSKWSKIFIVDSKLNNGSLVNGFEVIGDDNDLESLFSKGFKNAFITIGGIETYKKRKQIYNKLKLIGFSLPNIIDKSAYLSKFTILSEGIFIGRNVCINIDSSIGKCSIINTSSIVEHDCFLDNFSHLSTCTVLNGGVSIGEGTFIGSSTVIKNGIRIGENTIIGMGSNVLHNIPMNVTAYGNPCMVIKK